MGVDSADFNNDGWMDLFVANIDEEIFSLYQNNHDGTFDDVAMQQGIGMATRWMSGWGLKFFDYDNDGNMDLILSNGFPDDLVDQISNKVTYREPLLLFHNDGRSFRDVSQQSGPVFSKNFAARGLAVGDFNNDGAVDVLISVNDGAPVLLKNNAAKGRITGSACSLVGRKSNPDAIGARVTYQAGDLNRSRMKVGGGSFLSSHDPRMVLGLGDRCQSGLAGGSMAAAEWRPSNDLRISRSTGTSRSSKEQGSGSSSAAKRDSRTIPERVRPPARCGCDDR